jgi:AraC-like DNA-binding protein/quercetin dioxygenase-like cupin family protein
LGTIRLVYAQNGKMTLVLKNGGAHGNRRLEVESSQPRLSKGSFYGRIVKRREVAGFLLTELAYLANFRVKRHSHESAHFVLVLKGAYRENYGNKTRICKPGSLVFHPADEIHSNQIQNTTARDFSIEIAPGWIDRFRDYSSWLDNPSHFRGNGPALLAARLYREFQHLDEVSPLAIEALALEIAVAGARFRPKKASKPPRWLILSRDILHARFTESLRVADLAESVGIHPGYLASEFRRHYSSTVGQYVRKLRVRAACRDLLRSEAPIAQIASAVGFYDQSHFSRTFKQLTGMTPGQYRACFSSPLT